MIFFSLDDNFLYLALFLTQDFSGFSVSAAFFVKLQFNVTDLEFNTIKLSDFNTQFPRSTTEHLRKLYPRFQFANNPLAADQCVSFNFFQTDCQVFDFDLQSLLDRLDIDNAFLFLMKNIHSALKFTLGSLGTIISQLFIDIINEHFNCCAK